MEDHRWWVGPADSPDTYQLIRLLGQGGEAEVWEAAVQLSPSGRSHVAVKILPPPRTSGEVTEWQRQSHLLRSLDHPGVVRVVDVFTGPQRHHAHQATITSASGSPPVQHAQYRYVVMHLIPGLTMREWVDEHPGATISARLRALLMVAAALDDMHSGRRTGVPVAHGDVKPSNIVIRDDGSTVLVDLGLMRIADGQGRPGHSRPYAAPELFTSQAAATPAADSYAFAATVFHVLTGAPAPTHGSFGPDLEAVERCLAQTEITARRPQLVRALLQALHAAPQDRPRNLSVWLASLTDSLSQTTSQARTQSVESGSLRTPAPPKQMRSKSRRGLAIAVAAVAAAVLGIGAAVGVAAYLSRGHGSGSGALGASTSTPGKPTAAPTATATSPTNELTSTPSSDTSPSPDITSSSGGDPAVFHDGTATVAIGAGVDLDSMPGDPQWGTLERPSFGGPDDLSWRGNCNGAAICVDNFSQAVIVTDETKVQECTTITGYDTKSIALSKIRSGLVLCVYTRYHRYSLVRVTKFTSGNDPIVLHMTTLKTSGD